MGRECLGLRNTLNGSSIPAIYRRQDRSGRIIAALREFGLHAVFITPNKEMRLLRNHTRSAIVVHRRGPESTLTSLSWEALDEFHQQRIKAQHEIAG